MQTRLLSSVAALGFMLTACGTAQVGAPSGSTPAPSTPTSAPSQVQSPRSVPLHSGSPGRPTCPSTVTSNFTAVPAKPTIAGTTDALVPNEVPAYAVVCSYPAGTNMTEPKPGTTYRLSTSTPIAKGLEKVPGDLGHLMARNSSKACTAMGGPQTHQLLGLQYADGIVWVASLADVNNCSDSTNGRFTTSTSLGASLAHAASTRTWALRAPTGPCASLAGRTGSDRQLVPGEPTGLVVCTNSTPKTASADLRRRLQEAMNRLPTAVSQGWAKCSGASNSHVEVVFSYPAGPTVGISVEPKCQPQVLGAGRQAASAGEVAQILEDAGYL